MFEITRNDGNLLEKYIAEGKGYKKGVYDFTFENRHLIYHAPHGDVITYLALDMETGFGSEILRQKGIPVSEDAYTTLIPYIFKAIKYTGDTRYHNTYAQDPLQVIDSIFRVVLPPHGYNIREEQIRLSKDIYLGLTEKDVAICEAEVGTGKTMAYLVAALCAKKQMETKYHYGPPVTITTSSIELQKNLVEKEIPKLSGILMDYRLIDRPLTAVLRKGKEHYFCPARYEDYVSTISKYPNAYRETLRFFRETSFGLKAFDLDKVRIPGYLKDRLCVKGSCGQCRQSICQYRNYINKAMNLREPLDFQITNHNLYITSVKQANLLRPSQYVIIDEAHKFKDAAQDVYGSSVSEMDVAKYLRWVKTQCEHKSDRDAYQRAMTAADGLNKRIFSQLKAKQGKIFDADESGILELDHEITRIIPKLCNHLEFIEEHRRSKSGRKEISGDRIRESLMEFTRPHQNTIWIEIDDAKRLTLCCSPKDVSKRLYRGVWDGRSFHVLTSGTMSDGLDFEFFKKENGIDLISEHKVLEAMTKSPFDYAAHSRLYIPQDIPFPDEENPRYLTTVADRIVELIHATNGHTAILFTSYKLLRKVHALTKARLEDYEVIYMTKANKTAIADFKRSKNGVLFASGTMWEGVDCPGDCLSSVIIVRLPFPRRTAALEEKKGQYGTVEEFVKTIAVPEMLIKLRQGAGRLIRTETDTGVLTILDRRATQGAYAGRVAQALEKYPRVESLEEVAEFMRKVKPVEYFERGVDNCGSYKKGNL